MLKPHIYRSLQEEAQLQKVTTRTILNRIKAGKYPTAVRLYPTGPYIIRIDEDAADVPEGQVEEAAASVSENNISVPDLVTVAAMLARLAGLPTRPARAAGVALVSLHKLYDLHDERTTDTCPTCLWSAPCVTKSATALALSAMAEHLAPLEVMP